MEENEPNDNRETANFLGVGATDGQGTVFSTTGNVTSRNPDYYSLTLTSGILNIDFRESVALASSGVHDTYSISVTGGPFDANLRSRVKFPGDKSFSTPIFEDGDYFIIVEDAGGVVNSSTYNLTATFTSDDTSRYENETVNNFFNNNSIITSGTPIIGQLNSSGDHDYFSFQATGNPTTIEFNSRDVDGGRTASSSGAFIIEVQDRAGNELGGSGGITPGPDLGIGRLSSATFTVENLIEGTTYYAVVHNNPSTSHYSDEPYTLTMTNTVNSEPIAGNDTASLSRSQATVINIGDNDSDEDGDELTTTGLTQPTKGTVVYTNNIGSPDNVTYTPFTNVSGTDRFTYQVSDPSGLTDTATVNVTFENNAPVANDDSASLSRTQATVMNIGDNDSDEDGDELTTTGLTQPTKGTVVYTNNIGSPDNVTYTPFTNVSGTDRFTYQVSDPSGLTDTATVNVTFENNAPVANDDSALVRAGDTIQINVGLNDSDADNDLLTTSILTNPMQGSISLEDNVHFYDFISFTADSNALGSDSFTYQVSDGKGGTNTARVEITISSQTSEAIITGPEVYRFFNTESGTHFYSRDEFEANSILANLPHYRLDGPAFKAADATNGITADVFRFFNTQSGTHLFTQDTNERDTIIATLDHFNFEGIAYQGHPNPVDGSVPLYRFFNTQTGGHFYTVNETEKDNLIATASNIYNFESVAYNVYRPTDVEIAPVQSDTTPLLGVISTIENELGAL